jgi:hypothetical protein
VLAQQDAVAALKGLLASPDQTTAKFAASALRNLSLTPFSSSMGPSDPSGVSVCLCLSVSVSVSVCVCV